MSIECEQPFCVTVQENPCTISGDFSFTIAPQCVDKSSSIVTITGSTTGLVSEVFYSVTLDAGTPAGDAIDLIVGDGASPPFVTLPGVNPGPRLFHASPDRPFIGKIKMFVFGPPGCTPFTLQKPISLISDVGTYTSLSADTGIFLGVVSAPHAATDTWGSLDNLVGFGPALFYDIRLNKVSGTPGRQKDNWQWYVELIERIGGFPPADVRRWFAVYQKTPWPGCDTPKGTYNLIAHQFDHSALPDFNEAVWLAAYPSIATPAASVTVT